MVKKKEEKQPREYTRRQQSHHRKQQIRQRIILFGGIGIIVAVVLLISAGWYFGEYAPNNKTIATVYDTKIKESDMINAMEYYAAVYQAYGQQIDLTQQTDNILSSLVQNVLLRRGAEQVGVTVSDDEVNKSLGDNAGKTNRTVKEIVRAGLLTEKLKKDYFGPQVGDNGSQVKVNALLLESAALAPEVRDLLRITDNITSLVEKYAVNTASKNAKGFFDWHPQTVLQSDIGSSIPVNWAFSADVTAGQICDALSDNVSSKQLGYWLIRVNEKSQTPEGDATANVSAVLVSDMAQAEHVKSLLESTDNISAIAVQYSQYTPSKQGQGELGILVSTDNISTQFNDYVFGENAVIGKWSDPVKDTNFWTTGGAWVVQVLDKSDNRAYSTDDKNSLVDKAYTDWSNGLWSSSTTDIKYEFSDAQKQWAIDKVNKKIAAAAGG